MTYSIDCTREDAETILARLYHRDPAATYTAGGLAVCSDYFTAVTIPDDDGPRCCVEIATTPDGEAAGLGVEDLLTDAELARASTFTPAGLAGEYDRAAAELEAGAWNGADGASAFSPLLRAQTARLFRTTARHLRGED